MTQDVIALTPHMPDTETLLAGLFAGGPELRLGQAAGGAVAQLCAADGRALVSIEAPLYVQVPGEAQRLLGTRAESPLWWTEARATTSVPEAARLAGSIAGRLKSVLGGETWPPETEHTEVVTVDEVESSSGEEALIGVDILTDKAAVVIQDRPLIPAMTWLVDLLRTAAESGRKLQLVTPPGARLTFPMRSVLQRMGASWVVRDAQCGYYDGLDGAVLQWQDGQFAVADGEPETADAFTVAAPGGSDHQLLLSVRTIQPATGELVLGGGLETAWKVLAGGLPAGWSPSEPLTQPWSPRQLTEVARRRAQQGVPTWLVVIGSPEQPSIATVHVTHTPAGIEERFTLAVGYTSDQTPPLELLAELAESLATRHHLATMLCQLRRARADLTTPAHREELPLPVSFTLGPQAVRDIGLDQARQLSNGFSPAELGPAVSPALHFTVGDGTDAAAWDRLQELNRCLKAG
ncbi:hypothetical protein H9Y04_35545 [Streptomyces sp. TRM66268-LWL]|uniref:Uncharacterized protein n=1 Tax=Streptomyces polyasparticus TaxID=2767826 RepID=A0ABR7SQU0_9ACTN|nr:DUF6177 family protein [Streptomyces polyasparticus]MBC9717860.1 hypothetical protein [Streptomyces polyasparticus]